MKDFYNQLLFLILGILIGSLLLGENELPLAVTLIASVVSIIIIVSKIVNIDVRKSTESVTEAVKKSLENIGFSILLLAGSISAWIWYASIIYKGTLSKEISDTTQVLVVAVPLAVLAIVISVVYDVISRRINNKH